MVRVGGGWVALDEFLVKNDPCRGMSQLFQSIKIAHKFFSIPKEGRFKRCQRKISILTKKNK
jgi:hypothetical protein